MALIIDEKVPDPPDPIRKEVHDPPMIDPWIKHLLESLINHEREPSIDMNLSFKILSVQYVAFGSLILYQVKNFGFGAPFAKV